MANAIISRALLLCTIVVLAGCRESTGVIDHRAAVAGTYVLTTVAGQPVPTTSGFSSAVLAGELVLGADGHATRRVWYAIPVSGDDPGGSPGVLEDSATGTFTVRGDSVVLALTVASRPPVTVRWPAVRQGSMLTLRFPAPADGGDYTEVYRHRSP